VPVKAQPRPEPGRLPPDRSRPRVSTRPGMGDVRSTDRRSCISTCAPVSPSEPPAYHGVGRTRQLSFGRREPRKTLCCQRKDASLQLLQSTGCQEHPENHSTLGVGFSPSVRTQSNPSTRHSYELRSLAHARHRLAASGIIDLEQCHGGAVSTGYNRQCQLAVRGTVNAPCSNAFEADLRLLTSPVASSRPRPVRHRGHPVENEPPFPRECPRRLPSSSSTEFPLAQDLCEARQHPPRGGDIERSPAFHDRLLGP
jgi:hypothetical protein